MPTESMLTLPPDQMMRDYLVRPKRAPSGNLYLSSDILAPLRHSMLRVAGAPQREDADSYLGIVRMETGTLWHEKFERVFGRNGLPVMLEVNIKDYLPEGWSGRPDWIMWSDEYKAFVLGDLKTIKSSSVDWLRRGGIKEAHMWQLSAYWYALEKMGLPLVKAFYVLYLPMDDSECDVTDTVLIEGTPLDKELVLTTLEERNRAVREYLESIEAGPQDLLQNPSYYITDKLAPVQERVQKALWDGSKFVYEIKLAPHWSAAYCPYPVELCDCSTHSTNKIGQYEFHPDTAEIVYVPRKGEEYEAIKPIELTAAQLKKMQAEIARARTNDNEGG